MGQNLAKRIEHFEGRPTQFIRSTPVANFVMSCVTETPVCSLSKCLNDHKSSVNFPNKLIKIAAQPLSIPLKYIYNQSIETGIVSHILKVSQIPQCIRVVILQTLATLSPFSKVLKRVVYNQLYSLIS